MAIETISCWAIGITGASLGASVGFVVFALINAGADPDKHRTRLPRLEQVERCIAWAAGRQYFGARRAALELGDYTSRRMLGANTDFEWVDQPAANDLEGVA